MDTKTYAKHIRDNLDFVNYSSLILSLGNTLNSPKDRWFKSDIIESAFATHSNGKFKHIDLVGRDHRDVENNLDIEFKYLTDSLFTPKGKVLKKQTKTFKLKNWNGRNKGTTIEDPADFYLFAQQDSIAIMSFEEITPYLIQTDDSIEIQIPGDKLTFIFTPEDVKDKVIINENLGNNIKEELRQLINKASANNYEY